jgi:hypothetical protein
MTKQDIIDLLFFYCSGDSPAKQIRTFLEQHKENIDITHNNGLFFVVAINHKNPELLEILTQFFEETRLKHDTNSENFTNALEFLDFIFEILTDKDDPIAFKASPQTWHILHKYLDENSDIEDSDNICNEASSDSELISARSDRVSDITEENLKHWNELQIPSQPSEFMGYLTPCVESLTPPKVDIDASGKVHDIID